MKKEENIFACVHTVETLIRNFANCLKKKKSCKQKKNNTGSTSVQTRYGYGAIGSAPQKTVNLYYAQEIKKAKKNLHYYYYQG